MMILTLFFHILFVLYLVNMAYGDCFFCHLFLTFSLVIVLAGLPAAAMIDFNKFLCEFCGWLVVVIAGCLTAYLRGQS